MLLRAIRPVQRASVAGGALGRRGIKFLSQDYPPDKGFKLYSSELEKAINDTITKHPANSIAFQNSDGTANQNLQSDEGLKIAAVLAQMSKTKRLTFLDQLKLTNEQKDLYNANEYHLDAYYTSGRQILDKIPYVDDVTGEVKWEVIRQHEKEGWENIIYYGYVPGLLIALAFALFHNSNTIADWAMEELRIRSSERYNDTASLGDESKLSPEEIKKRDALIVERIISGDYDRLSGLKKSAGDLPASLL